MTSSFGYGNYAAISAKLEKRYSNGLQFLTSYIWCTCPGEQRYAAQRIGQLRSSGSDQLRFRVFERCMGYPTQLHDGIQLRNSVRQRKESGAAT